MPMVEIKTTTQNLAQSNEPVILCFFEDELTLNADFKSLDAKYANVINSAIKENMFKGVDCQILPLYLNKIILAGFGKKEKAELRKVSNTLAQAIRGVRGLDIKKATIHLDNLLGAKFGDEELYEKAAISMHLGLYQYNNYKTKDLDKVKSIETISISMQKGKEEKAKKILARAKILGEAVMNTRDLVNTPPNIAIPQYAAEYATQLAKQNKLKIHLK